jgi:hypothetical protein
MTPREKQINVDEGKSIKDEEAPPPSYKVNQYFVEFASQAAIVTNAQALTHTNTFLSVQSKPLAAVDKHAHFPRLLCNATNSIKERNKSNLKKRRDSTCVFCILFYFDSFIAPLF